MRSVTSSRRSAYPDAMVSTPRMLLVLAALSSACGSADAPAGQAYVRNAGTDICTHARDPNVARADFDPNLGIGHCVYFCTSANFKWCPSAQQCVALGQADHCSDCDQPCRSPGICRYSTPEQRPFSLFTCNRP